MSGPVGWRIRGNVPLYKEVRSIFARAPLGFAAAPGGDLGVMPGEKDIRNFPAAKLRRARVLRRFEQPAAETVLTGRLFVPENAWNQPDDRIDKDDSGDRTVGQNVIANRNLGVDQVLDDAMIDALVVTAENDEMITGRKFLR